jgi:proline iminopeptidase
MLDIPSPRESGYTTTTEVPLYWCAYGAPGARRLMVLHGGPGADHRYLLPQMLDLAKDNELVFYDQRGGGLSRTDAPAPITWQTHVRDLAAVAKELGFPKVELVGYSWGGLLAMLYALSGSDSLGSSFSAGVGNSGMPAVDSLVLIDPAPITRAYREQFEAEFSRRQQGPVIQAMRAELGASGLRERDPDAYKHRSFELSVAGYFADPRRARDLTPFRVVGRVQQSVWGSLADFDLRASLEHVDVPSLVVHGRQDPIPVASSEAAARALRARLVVLDDCGHVPYVEQGPSLFDAVREFLTTNRRDLEGHAP